MHTECVCLRKKKSSAGTVDERAGARQNGLTFFYCKDPNKILWLRNAHTDLELCW